MAGVELSRFEETMKQPVKIRIGYFDDSAKLGGTTRYLLDLIGHLDREIFEPVFFPPASRSWHDELRKLNVKIVGSAESSAPPAKAAQAATQNRPRRISLPKSLSWHLGLARDLMRLRALFASEPVDIYHSNNVGAEPAPIAAKWTGRPVVGTLHVDPSYDLDGRFSTFRYRQLEKWCFRSLDAALAVSRRTAETWAQRCGLDHQYIARRMRVIYNGIDSSRMQRRSDRATARRGFGLPPDAVIVASLGRLEPAKGYEDLVRALALAIREIPQIHAAIGGAGILRDELLGLASSLGVQAHLHLVGFLPEVTQLLDAADIYVQPSLCEALAYGVLEASGFGLPAIITDVGGMPEIVESGKSGCVVPARHPEALAKAICLLAGRPDLRQQLGRAAAERVRESFSIDEMCARTMDVYRSLLRDQPKRNTGQ
jgi:glycosyltransferase involved in cell wall biosynthesis